MPCRLLFPLFQCPLSKRLSTFAPVRMAILATGHTALCFPLDDDYPLCLFICRVHSSAASSARRVMNQPRAPFPTRTYTYTHLLIIVSKNTLRQSVLIRSLLVYTHVYNGTRRRFEEAKPRGGGGLYTYVRLYRTTSARTRSYTRASRPVIIFLLSPYICLTQPRHIARARI